MTGTEYLTAPAPVVSTAAFLAGVFVGLFIRVRIDSTKRIPVRLNLERHPFSRWGDYLFRIVLAALFLFSVLYLVDFTAVQRECNAEFRQQGVELRKLTNEDRELEERDDELRDRDALDQTAWIKGLLTMPIEERQSGGGLRITEEWVAKIDATAIERAGLREERDEIDEKRAQNTYLQSHC